MALGLRLGLGLTNWRNKTKPKPNEDILCAAIASKKRVIATVEGERLLLEPYVVYASNEEGKFYVDSAVIGEQEPPSNRPPELRVIAVATIESVKISNDSFTVHPALRQTLAGYENVKCIVELI